MRQSESPLTGFSDVLQYQLFQICARKLDDDTQDISGTIRQHHIRKKIVGL